MPNIIKDVGGRVWVCFEGEYCVSMLKGFRVIKYLRGVMISYKGMLLDHRECFRDAAAFKMFYVRFLNRIDFKEGLHDVDRRMSGYVKDIQGKGTMIRVRKRGIFVLDPKTNHEEYACSPLNPSWRKIAEDKRRGYLNELESHLITPSKLLSLIRPFNQIVLSDKGK